MRGTVASYAINEAKNIKPRRKGVRTCTDDHEKRIPPQDRPIIARVVPIITIKLPLIIKRLSKILIKYRETYSQSTLASLLETEPSGVRTLRKRATKIKEAPQIGRLRSKGIEYVWEGGFVHLEETYRTTISRMHVQKRHLPTIKKISRSREVSHRVQLVDRSHRQTHTSEREPPDKLLVQPEAPGLTKLCRINFQWLLHLDLATLGCIVNEKNTTTNKVLTPCSD